MDSRRRGLEQYLEKVCAVRVIAESDAMQEFLTDQDDENNITPVDLKVSIGQGGATCLRSAHNNKISTKSITIGLL